MRARDEEKAHVGLEISLGIKHEPLITFFFNCWLIMKIFSINYFNLHKK